MLSISVLLTFFFPCCLSFNLIYKVKEETNTHTFVGDITADPQFQDVVPSGDIGQITFNQLKLKGTQIFNVSESGKIYTIQTLDAEALCTFEKECFQEVKVAVHKRNTFIKILKIKVVIEDINDHQPEFPDKEITLQFGEGDREGMKKSIPNAIDKDVGVLNSVINYHLKDNEEMFSLLVSKRADGISRLEIVLESKLNREGKDHYSLEVIAKDGGSPSKESVLKVNIEVQDENDNLPVFQQKLYNISVKKTQDKNKAVVIVSAEDLDIGKNGEISYYFSPKTLEKNKQYFKLDKITGEILFSKNTNFNEETFKLYIEARDGGSPPLSSIATVMVNVINQHNNPPNIDVNFISTQNHNTATILEDIKVGSFIAYVMVTDNDVGHNGEVNLAAVIVSIAIVVSITLCIVRCNNVRNSSSERTAEEKQAYQCRNEMRQLIYQGNNSVPVMSGNRGETSDRYGHSRSHYYPEDWKTSTMNRSLQKSTKIPIGNDINYSWQLTMYLCLYKVLFYHQQKYSQPIEVTSYGDNRPSSNYPTDTLTSRKSSGQCWSERSSRQYEEIPAMSGIYGGAPPDVSSTIERDHYQDRYVKPPERQLPSTPDVVVS
uniref:Cadherin domain-containing protein n=1 Tax=Octopus bimaculoides TaxID=37653 RepID=A0A0L8FH16_OCTBM